MHAQQAARQQLVSATAAAGAEGGGRSSEGSEARLRGSAGGGRAHLHDVAGAPSDAAEVDRTVHGSPLLPPRRRALGGVRGSDEATWEGRGGKEPARAAADQLPRGRRSAGRGESPPPPPPLLGVGGDRSGAAVVVGSDVAEASRGSLAWLGSGGDEA